VRWGATRPLFRSGWGAPPGLPPVPLSRLPPAVQRARRGAEPGSVPREAKLTPGLAEDLRPRVSRWRARRGARVSPLEILVPNQWCRSDGEAATARVQQLDWRRTDASVTRAPCGIAHTGRPGLVRRSPGRGSVHRDGSSRFRVQPGQCRRATPSRDPSGRAPRNRCTRPAMPHAVPSNSPLLLRLARRRSWMRSPGVWTARSSRPGWLGRDGCCCSTSCMNNRA
jgi:hypothetical protein